jgi:hypothetical protein
MVTLLLASAVAMGLLTRQPAFSPRPQVAVPADNSAGAALSRTGGLCEPLVITNQTQVRLDGNPCRWQEVPREAIITGAEVSPDRKTILRIHFRSPK